MEEQVNTIWNLINTGGVVAVLIVNLVLLLRGDLLPRRVYEKLTTNILQEFCERMTKGIRAMFREELNRNILE